MRTVVSMVLLILCSFCASAPTGNDEAVIIPGVPFFSQEAYQCGPATLATVMDYWYRKQGADKWVTPEEIASRIYSPTAKGVLGLDLELYAQKQGFEVRQYSGDLQDLKRHVDQGVPLIIFVDYGFSVYEVNHFMVVTGYTKNGVVVNSGKHENQPVSDRDLERIWKKTRYWTLALKRSA